MIRCVDPDAAREGLEETPDRMAKAWLDHTSGYGADVAGILKVFEDGAGSYDEMVVVGGIQFYSRCEHHGEAIFGQATIGYLPTNKIVGLSKLVRLTDVFAKRLQVQERMTAQICDAIMEHLQPLGVGVMVRARHLCMESRGVCRHGTITTTMKLGGALREGAPREEFLKQAQQYSGPL